MKSELIDRRKMKRQMTGHTVLLLAFFAFAFAFSGCEREELFEILPEDEGFPIVGEYVNAQLILNVGDTYVNTKSEDPDLENPEHNTDAEKAVDGFWVFQYDATSGEIVNGSPKYLTDLGPTAMTYIIETENVLTTNNGNKSIVYVVANVGSSSNWISSDSYATLDGLLAASIPNPEPIYTDASGDPESAIPMGGQSVEVTVNDLAIVVVPVYRMFAKMEINVKVSLEGLVESSSVEAEPVTLDVGSVPNVCYVGSLYTGDDSKAAEYPFNVEFLPHTFSMTPSVDDPDYVYVLYVPENIQGEVENPDPDTVSKSDIAPADATMVTTHLSLTTEVEGEKVSIKADPQYTVYPGGNITDNFNIRRNCVYRVNVTIYPDDVVSPCANCLVASVGEFFAFYPYERDEVGHRDDAADKGDDNEGYSYYDIQNHIYPYEKGDEYYDTSKNYTGKQIKGVKIIWQTENAIGNNTNKNLVWVENGNSQRCRIYVRANQVGNALIGAYSDADCTGDILWSWHIWITDFNPDNVDNALTYYHYKWDENGINTDNNQREEGYPLMICNLGALATDVTGDSPSWDNYTKTYGLLYQWGRKDPFPPAKYNGNGSGSYPNGKTHKMYNYDEATANVVVYDNNHNKITMTNNTGTAYATSGNSVFNTVLATTGYSTNADGIDYSIKHPTTFLAAADFGGDTSGALDDASGSYYNNTNYYYNQGDWLPVGDNDLWGGNGTFGVVASEKHLSILTYANDGVEANLEDNYGKYKTIFDPCPYGWRISPGDLWLGMTSDGKNYNYGNTGLDMYENVNCEETTAAKVADHMGFHMYLEKWHQGKTSFFPTQGSRLANGRPYLGGVCGNYHNATVDEVVTVKNYGGAKVENAIRRVDIIHFHADASSPVKTQVQPFETQLCYYCRAVAGPVRCVRDTQK